GYDVAREIRASAPRETTAILMMSSAASILEDARAADCGIFRRLSKPLRCLDHRRARDHANHQTSGERTGRTFAGSAGGRQRGEPETGRAAAGENGAS